MAVCDVTMRNVKFVELHSKQNALVFHRIYCNKIVDFLLFQRDIAFI